MCRLKDIKEISDKVRRSFSTDFSDNKTEDSTLRTLAESRTCRLRCESLVNELHVWNFCNAL